MIRDDSDDLFENSSVNSDDDHTDIQNDIRRNRAPFAISEQHSACTTTSKRAKNTRVSVNYLNSLNRTEQNRIENSL